MKNGTEAKTAVAKPFLKWAGGKTQLLEQIEACLPIELKFGKIKRYVEPFVGSGALFFNVAQNYEVEEFIISDINDELILCFKTIKKDVEKVIDSLSALKKKYLELTNSKREEFYYKVRKLLNLQKVKINFKNYDSSWIERTAQIIFLNKTCYNGLFRVNSKGEFNVPFGDYKNPNIFDEDNLYKVSKLLQKTKILCGDFVIIQKYVDDHTFVYFDPPYRPISKTASFTSYSKFDFNDKEQLRLAGFYNKLNRTGAKLMLSNSDPKNEKHNDDFFENAYSHYNIKRVSANRMINCNAEKRGTINELLITNY